MSSSQLSCVFQCETTSIFCKVKKFTEEYLQQCRDVLRIRVAFNLKYCTTILPDCPDDFNGYHADCRSNFMAVSKVYVQKYEQLMNNKSVDPDAASTSFASVSDDTIKQVPESDQVTSMAVDMEEENQEPIAHKDGSEASSSSNQKKCYRRFCFFCGRDRKFVGNRLIPFHETTVEKLKNRLLTLSCTFRDYKIEKKFDALGENAKIYYHNACRSTYLKKTVIGPSAAPDSDWHKKKYFHELVYEDICGFVQKNIIDNKGYYSLDFITDCYNDILETYWVQEFESFDTKYKRKRLLKKLQKTFGVNIKTISVHRKRLIIPGDGDVIDDETLSEFQNFEVLTRAALLLRKKVSLIEKKPLPTPLELNDIVAGECEIPKDLTNFMQNLLYGMDSSAQNSFDCNKVNSISQDIIYAVYNGELKTSKHMTLGMTLKCITNDRRVIDLVNKFGYCCSYGVIEEIERNAGTCYAFNISPEELL